MITSLRLQIPHKGAFVRSDYCKMLKSIVSESKMHAKELGAGKPSALRVVAALCSVS